jgi:hypothetical protein
MIPLTKRSLASAGETVGISFSKPKAQMSQQQFDQLKAMADQFSKMMH